VTVRILSGTEAALALLASLKPKVKRLNPKLVIVQVGNDPASTSYIKKKLESCKEIGMRCEHRHLPEETTFEELHSAIESLNTDTDVTGFIVQLPLPSALAPHTSMLLDGIDPAKDIDGFTATNAGMLLLGRSDALPAATPAGIMALLTHEKIGVRGKHAVVVGRSNIVGKPLALLLLNEGATVTICHSQTQDLAARTREADLLFVAVGKAGIITKDMVKKGAVVIDVGVNRVEGKLIGDVDFEGVKEVAAAITPVPGGVGPMTVASLIQNCVRAAERNARNAK